MAKSRQKTSAAGKIIACVLALAVAVGGVLCCGYASRTDEGWFKNPNISTWHWADKADEQSNVLITEGGSNGVQLMSAAIAVEDFEAYGLDEEATETAYTLTITKSPADSVTTRFTWSAEFVNPASSWANGKTVADYLTVTPAEDNGSAVVACKQAFGEQIRVKVVYNDDTTIFATRMADYVKRVTGISIDNNYGRLAYGDECNYSTPPMNNLIYGVGTVQGAIDYTNSFSGWYELSEEAYNYLLSADSTAHEQMSQFLAANNNSISVITKAKEQQFDPEPDDWFEDCTTTSFLEGYQYSTAKALNSYNAAFKEMLKNTTNQTRCGFRFTYKYGSYSEVVTVYSEWVTTPASYVIILNNIGLNGNELIF